MISASLRLLGRHARPMLPVGVTIGLILPPLAEALQFLVTPAVVGLLTAALLRLDWTALKSALARPGLPFRITLWQLIVSPLAVWALARVGIIPDAFTVLSVLQAASAPIGSTAAFALFLGIPGQLCMTGTVMMTLAVPFTLTATVALLLPSFGIQIDLLRFFGQAAFTALAPFVITAAIRHSLGETRLRELDGELAGVTVVLMVLFAVAIMHGVTATFLEQPSLILRLMAWSWIAAIVWHLVGYLLLRRVGQQEAMSAALMLGNRNLGITLAVTAGTAGEAFQMYAGLAQIPLFCAPLLLAPVREWLGGKGR